MRHYHKKYKLLITLIFLTFLLPTPVKAQGTQGIDMEVYWYGTDNVLSYRNDIAKLWISQNGECCLTISCYYRCFFVLPLASVGETFIYEIYGETTSGRGPTITLLVGDTRRDTYEQSVIVPRSKELRELFIPYNAYELIPQKPPVIE